MFFIYFATPFPGKCMFEWLRLTNTSKGMGLNVFY